MSKFARKILTMGLCVTMLLGSTLSVSAADATVAGTGTDVEGTNTVEEPIYSVTLPVNLEFAVDAFEQKGQGQIVSTDIYCVNNSNVAIKMNVAIALADAAGDADVTFAASADAVSSEDDVKSVFMQAQVAKTVTETKNAAAAYATPLVKYNDVYYASDSVADTVEGSDVTTADAVEMETVKSIATTVADTPVAYTLGTEATELNFALAASEYVKYWADETTEEQQFKTTAAENKSTASFTFTGKVNPNVVWEASDFKATATYTFKGMLTSDYEAATFVEDAHALLEIPSEPTFASNEVGVITWSGDAGTGKVSEITSVTASVFGGEYDLLEAQSGLWDAAEIDLENKTITLDSDVAVNIGENTEVTITYKDSSSTPATKTVEGFTVKLAN